MGKNEKNYYAENFSFDLLDYEGHGNMANFYNKMTSYLLLTLILVLLVILVFPDCRTKFTER